MAFTVPAHLWGFVVSGDIGGYTAYTDRYGRKVIYPKAPPEKPPSPLQVVQRERFTTAQLEYMNLSVQEKLDWETLTQRASLCMTGQNLFIHVAMRGTYDTLDTLERQFNTSVTRPTPV